MSEPRSGSGPLADRDIVTGGPIDDPATADRNNPRWAEDPTAASPDAQPLGGPGAAAGSGRAAGSGSRAGIPAGSADDRGTPQDQAAQPLEGELETGRDNIREGRGGGVTNPALAEGGDNG